MITFSFLSHFEVAGLLLLCNVKSTCSSETLLPLPPSFLLRRSLCVCLINHRGGSCSRHGSSSKGFWNEGLKTHLFWMIPILRETDTNQNSLAAVCWNIWTLFPACDIIFLPGVQTTAAAYWGLFRFRSCHEIHEQLWICWVSLLYLSQVRQKNVQQNWALSRLISII